ncbi:MAG: hypothetical protein WA213_14450 [Terriglobales bacterium]
MKPTMAISVCVLAAGLALAQNPAVIQNTRATMNGVRDTTAAASNVALGGQRTPAPSHAGPHGPAVTVHPSAAPGKAGAARSVHARSHHWQRPGHMVTAEVKTGAAPTVEQVAQSQNQNRQKIGEIVGNAEPTAADGTSADDTAANAKYNANGKRDPFVSPVVAHGVGGGSGCSTGKKCLEIAAVNLRGVVHSENGFIAVVSNSLNKAYFLRENDPVFNGYVVRITGDSIVFQETLQDRLGKTFTREVTKKITVPAV